MAIVDVEQYKTEFEHADYPPGTRVLVTLTDPDAVPGRPEVVQCLMGREDGRRSCRPVDERRESKVLGQVR